MANYKRNMKTSSPLAHWYLGLINCGVAAVLFTAEVSAGGIGISNPPLINVNFGGHLTPAGLNINKVGIAAIGQATNDLWNFYSRDVAPGQWRQNGAITNLQQADGGTTAAGLVVNNLPGAWYNGSSDTMYNGYLYPQSGTASVELTNLPAGRYEVYLYSGQGNFQLQVGSTNYGTLTTFDVPVTNPPAWQAGVQYARFTNVQVAAGQAVKVSLLPGAGGGPCISGLQVLQSAPSTPLTITVQPAGRTVFEGADVAFQVTATGTYPLKYQWSFNGTNLPAATSDTLVVASAAISAAGLYSVRVTNTEGAITSTAAPLTVVRFASNALINVNFGGHLTPEGLSSNKVGVAASGQTTNDLWNFYSRDTASGQWKQDGALSSLQRADGAVTAAGIEVHNLPGAWFNGAIDTMYHGYLYPQSGNATLLMTNLPAGQYDVYLYSGQGNFQLQVGSVDYGVRTTYDVPIVNPQMWREGVQYARFTSVQVATGQAVRVSLLPGAGGGPGISGLQVLQTTLATPPTITVQPAGQTVLAGATASFTATAVGTPPLSYQWRLNGTNLPGATGTLLTLSNVKPASAGNYSVSVTNSFGSALSSNATLTVILPCAPAPTNMVSWWRGEGNGWDQISGNNGVLVNGAGFEAGVVGQAFSFNGSSNSYLEVADSPALRLTNALTIECWAKRLNTSQVHILMEKGGDWTGGQANFELALNDTYSGGKHFGFSFAGGWRGCAVTPDTAWHHYAAVAVSGQTDPTLYIDGVPQTISYRGGAATMSLHASTRPLHIGAQVDPQTGWLYYSSTLIDEPAIFNRPLAASEIQAIYTAGSSGKCPAGVAPWIMTQPAGQTVVAGSAVTFTVSAAGTPQLRYQWRKGGSVLPGSSIPTLELTTWSSPTP